MSRSEYVPIPNFDGASGEMPRLLTEEEIEDIISVLDPPPGVRSPLGVTQEIRDTALVHLKNFMRQTIANNVISPLAIPYAKEEIRRQYQLALVLPGKPVGLRCAEAFIATVMQATLNTRHKAGSGVDVGFDAVREVIFLPARRKQELVFLHFLDRKTREEILDYRAQIVYRNVWHFVTDYDIDFRDKFREEVDGEFKDEWWVPFQRKLLGIEDANVPIMRLYLNVVMMAEYKTSPR